MRCTKCRQIKPRRDFGRRSASHSGLQPWCKACKSAYDARRYKEKGELMREQMRAWKIVNREKFRTGRRRWEAKNRERRRRSKMRVSSLRRLRFLTAPGMPTREDLEARMAMLENKCFYCGGPFDQVDHTRPLSRGGSHLLANLRPICLGCNLRKNNKTHSEYLAYLALEASLRTKT